MTQPQNPQITFHKIKNKSYKSDSFYIQARYLKHYIHPTTNKRYDFKMEAISLTLNISTNSWSNLASKDSFEISSSRGF